MTEARTLDVSGLPAHTVSNQSLLWAGQLLMCVIEGCVLCMLIGTYFYLRLGVDVWPPPMVRLPGLFLPTLGFVPLIASCAGSYWASEAAKRNDRGGMLSGLSLNLALGIGFLVLRGIEWKGLNFTWASDAHG